MSELLIFRARGSRVRDQEFGFSGLTGFEVDDGRHVVAPHDRARPRVAAFDHQARGLGSVLALLEGRRVARA